MSIGALAVSEVAISGQAASAPGTGPKKPPQSRIIVASSDAVAQPEAR